jgi:hypothetical protein
MPYKTVKKYASKRNKQKAVSANVKAAFHGEGHAKRVEKLGVVGARKQEQAIAYSEAGISKKNSGDKKRTTRK